MTGPCAKARVVCTLVTPEGYRFVGTNDCQAPQATCPRIEAGHGRDQYELCVSICKQTGHAEIMALKAAREWAVGATAYVTHWRCCDACEQALERAGVREIVLGEAP